MKKKIEDYKDKKVAVECSSKEEWDKIKLLLGNHKTTKEYGDKRPEDSDCPTNCIHINGKGTGTRKIYEEEREEYVIYPASDFLEEDFVLPEKWKVVVTLENKDVLTTWKKKISFNRYSCPADEWKYIEYDGNGTNDENSYVTITFEQFEKYVLGEEVNQQIKLEKGKWYCKHKGVSESGALKFDSFEGTDLRYSERIYSDFRYVSKSDVAYWKLDDIREVSLSEIEQYLLEGHVDKIKTEIIPEYIECYYSSFVGFTKDKIYKCGNKTTSNRLFLTKDNGTTNDFPFEGGFWKFKISTKEAYDFQSKPKQLTVDDFNLIEGEIYYHNIGLSLFKYTYPQPKYYLGNMCTTYHNTPNGNFEYDSVRLATSEEKKWLNTCISQDKFITKEDLHLYDDNGLLIKKEKIMFKKGDYIVVLKDASISNCWENFVLKQIKDYASIMPELTPAGFNNFDHSQSYSVFSDKNKIWRYATSEEISEYNRIEKPFDVTKLKKEWSKGTYVVITKKYNVCEIGEIHKIDSDENYDSFINISTSVGISLKKNLKWFATKEDAEKFSKTILASIKKEDCISGKLYVYDEQHLAEFPTGRSLNLNTLRKTEKHTWMWNLDIRKPTQEEIDKFNLAFNSIDNILKEAKIKYPKGTIIKEINGKSSYVIKEDLYIQGKGITHYGINYVYYDGKWAEILSPSENSTYKIGDWVVITQNVQEKGMVFKIKCQFNDIIGRWSLEGSHCSYTNEQIRKALPHEIPTLNCLIEKKESFQTAIYDLKDICIVPITKNTKKIQTITIESPEYLNLNLKQIKPKQIQTIKI